MDSQPPPRISLLELAKTPFLDHASDVSGSLVYLDPGAAELTHASLGAPFLLGLGALNVCDLEGACPQDALLAELSGQNVTSLVIMVTRLLTDLHSHMLKAVLAHPTVSSVLILSSVSEHAHACLGDGELGVEAYSDYATMLQGDVEDSRAAAAAGAGPGKATPAVPITVKLKHAPMHLCVVDESGFVLPAKSAAAMQARAGGTAAGLQGVDDNAAADDGKAAAGLSLLAHALAGLASQLGGRLDTHALGPVSALLAREVASLPTPSQVDNSNLPAGTRPPSLGLILIDRSLDLVAPASHPDHLMDLLMASLPRQNSQASAPKKPTRRPAHVDWRSLEVHADVPRLSPLHTLPGGPPEVLDGAELLQPNDRAAVGRLDQLTVKKSKDGAALVRKWLKQALSAEKLAPSQRSKAGPVTPQELHGLVDDLLANPGTCVARALPGEIGSVASRWEASGSLERQLVGMLVQMGVEEGGQAVCGALRDALTRSQHEEAPLLPTDVLSLLPAIFSATLDAAGLPEPSPTLPRSPFGPEDTANIRASIVDALQHQIKQALAAPPAPSEGGGAGRNDATAVAAAAGLSQVLPGWRQYQKGEVGSQVDLLLHRLQYVAQARNPLVDLRRVTVNDMFAENVGSLVPLVRTVTRKVLQGAELPDIKQVTPESLGGLLSKGLSRMGLTKGLLGAVAGSVAGSRTQSLRDATTLLVFIVGGVSLAEMREVRQEAELHTDVRVLVSGTALISPNDVIRQFLAA